MLRLQPEDVCHHLKTRIYTRIQRSPLGGIGVFAIRDIPQGIDPFCEEDLGLEFIKVRADLIENDPEIPPGVKAYVRDITSCTDGMRSFPVNGFNSISACYLMNHSPKANVGHDEQGRSLSLRDIRAGEELTLDYRTFNDDSELFFEDSTQDHQGQDRASAAGSLFAAIRRWRS